MRLRPAVLALVFLPLLAAAAPAPPPAPDLRVVSVTSPNLDGGIVRVQVRNQGTAAAPASILSVQLTGLQQGTTSVSLKALAVNETVIKDVQTGKLLSQVHFMVMADRGNHIPEPNEQNNYLSGQFGGKP
jgi:subtilase family serine protease